MANRASLFAVGLIWGAAQLGAAVPWHHPLSLANHGYWPQRVAVTFHKDTAKALAGDPVEVRLPALAGARVESLRVCRADGVELLFELRDTRGSARRTGLLAAEDRLVLPAEAPGKGSNTLFVYAGNALAWPVADFLPGGLANGDFEAGRTAPEGWRTASADARHLLSWEATGGRNGSRGVKAMAPAGAPATWFQWQQRSVAVVPGRTYQFSGWVRAEEVVGSAGWYIHVNGERMELVNRTLDAGPGTYEWKEVTSQFTAPTNADTATLGTVLHGTGRAWFDDVRLVELGGGSALRVAVGGLELAPLTPARSASSNRAGPNQAEAVVRNFSADALASALVRLNWRAVLARWPGVPWGSAGRVASSEGADLPCYQLGRGTELLFAANLAPHSEHLFRVGLAPQQTAAPGASLHDYERLLGSAANLVTDGSFESGDEAPALWRKPVVGGPHQVKAGVSAAARFGKRGLELTVGENARGNWLGWQSREIPVKPGATYLVSGWLQALELKGSAGIHVHFHDAKGALTQSGAMASTQPGVGGTSEWVNSMAFLHAPPDAASVQLHLTHNTQGTLRHDGLVLCQVVEADLLGMNSGPVETRATELQVWEVNPLVKVFPDTPPQRAARAATLELARNEYEPLQLAVRRPAGSPAGRLEVTVSPLRNEAGATLPAVTVERVGFVPIDSPSAYYSTDVPEWCRKVPRGAGATDGWAGWWPDPLRPGGAFELPAGQTQPLWLTARAPRDAAPGEYRATISLRAEGLPARTLPLTARVLPFALPETTRLQVIFDFRFGPGGGLGSGADSPEARRQWLRFMADHRLGLDEIRPEPKFTYQDGRVSMDATEFDQAARYCFDELRMSAAYTPSFFYMFGWAYPPKKFFGLEPFTPEWTAAFQQAYRLFSEHVRARGWHDKFVYYISDEPHFQHAFVVEQMRKLCALIHQVDATIPIYSSTWRHCPEWDEALDLWGVGQFGCFPVAEMERLQRAGKRMWFTCDGQMATDTPYLATERMLPYYCFKYGAKGFEFWGLAWWTYDPWQTGWHQFIRQSDEGKKYYWVRYPDGDGFLAYPGQPIGVEGPVSTIRLEQVREGLEDYEALMLLVEQVAKAKAAGRPVAAAERALALARDLVTIPNAGGLRSTEILPEPQRLTEARQAVNAALVELGR